MDQSPKKYVVKSVGPEGVANTVLMEKAWENAHDLEAFVQPWGNAICPKMTFRALHDDNNLFLRYDVQDAEVLVYEAGGGKMEVTQSDRVEIFMACDPKLEQYYCLEIDPKGRVLDYQASFHRQFEYSWQWPDNQLSIETSIEQEKYTVQVAIGKNSLKQLGLLAGNRMLAGIYLGHCQSLPNADNTASILNWITWIDPQLEHPDFHVPGTFGVLELVD
nr:carbohydrate-binding family 9-like protein [Allomuricauda sp.]